MGDRTAFFYGTLMSPQILRRVLDRPLTDLTITPAILPDHSRRHVRGADYPGMIAHKGSEVRGTFVTGLNDRDIGRLDVFEGPQYVKRNVRVRLISEEGQKSGNGARKVGADGLVEAETYIFLNKKDLEEKEWDYEEFKREKLSRWVGSNEEYEDLSDSEVEMEAEDAEDFGKEKEGKSSEMVSKEKEALESAV